MKNYTEQDSFGAKFPENITELIKKADSQFSYNNYSRVASSTTNYGSAPITLDFATKNIFRYVYAEACHYDSQRQLNEPDMKNWILFNFIFPHKGAIKQATGFDKDYYNKVIYLYENFVMNEETSPWKDILKYFRLEVRGEHSFQVMYCEDVGYLNDYEYAMCMNFLIFSRMFSEHACGAVTYELVTKYNVPFEVAVMMAETCRRNNPISFLSSKDFTVDLARSTGHGPFNGGRTFYRWLFGLGPNKDIKLARPTLYISEGLWGLTRKTEIPNSLPTSADALNSSAKFQIGSLSGYDYRLPDHLVKPKYEFLEKLFQDDSNTIQRALTIYSHYKKVAESELQNLTGK